jgi:hypothetical protein
VTIEMVLGAEYKGFGGMTPERLLIGHDCGMLTEDYRSCTRNTLNLQST